MPKKKSQTKVRESKCKLALLPMPKGTCDETPGYFTPNGAREWLCGELPSWIQLIGIGGVYAKDASTRGSFAILAQDLAALTEACLDAVERDDAVGMAVSDDDVCERRSSLAEMVRAFTNAGDEPDVVGPQIEALADELVKLCNREAA